MLANKFPKTFFKGTLTCKRLMGIGVGDKVATSGESEVFHILAKTCLPPYCIFDVGANKGQFLKLALRSVKTKDFSIHCFEPGIITFNALLQSAGKNSKVKLNNHGLGREKSQMTLHYDNAGSGLASLTKRRLDHFGVYLDKSELIDIDTIDNYCQLNAIDRIHLLKIDVKGHELEVLAGAAKMFDKRNVDIVSFEFGGCNIDTRVFFQDFWYFFAKLKMRIFRITPSGYVFPIWSYSEIHEQFRTQNYIAIRNELSLDRVGRV